MSVDLEFTAKGRGSATHILQKCFQSSTAATVCLHLWVYLWHFPETLLKRKPPPSSVFMEFWPDSSREQTALFPVFFIFTASEWLNFRYLGGAVMY